MYKIAISGKANSGKDTASKLFIDAVKSVENEFRGAKSVAFADPIKKIIKIMFPKTKHKFLYGPSKYRMEIIEGARKNGLPVSIRQLAQEIGTDIGREYNKNIWIDALDYEMRKAEKKGLNIFIIKDVRFENEHKYAKDNGYITIRLRRNEQLTMSHSSETEQDTIPDSEYDYVLNNDGTIEDLKNSIFAIILEISKNM